MRLCVCVCFYECVLYCVRMHNHRLKKLMEVLNTIKNYSSLSLSHIEGIETYNNRFNLLVTNLRKKTYDPLDARRSEFDLDFDEFKRQLVDINVSRPLNSHDFTMTLTVLAL